MDFHRPHFLQWLDAKRFSYIREHMGRNIWKRPFSFRSLWFQTLSKGSPMYMFIYYMLSTSSVATTTIIITTICFSRLFLFNDHVAKSSTTNEMSNTGQKLKYTHHTVYIIYKQFENEKKKKKKDCNHFTVAVCLWACVCSLCMRIFMMIFRLGKLIPFRCETNKKSKVLQYFISKISRAQN